MYLKFAAKPLPTKNLKWSYKKDDTRERSVTFLSKNEHSLLEVFEHNESYEFAMCSETENEALQGRALWKNYDRTLETTVYRVPWIEIRDAHARMRTEQTKENFHIAMRQYIEYLFQEDVKRRLLHEIRNAKIPDRMNVKTFKMFLENMNRRVDMLPGPQTPLSVDDLKLASFRL